MSINRVMISGNLTRDPELRQTGSGMAVMTFGVDVNDRRRNQQTGEWEDYANFVDCTMFGNRAQGVHPYLSKGMKVAIEGKLRYSSWEREGQRRSKLEVIVDELEFMTSRNGQQGGNGGYNNGYNNNGYNNGYGNGGYAPQANQAPMSAPMPAAMPNDMAMPAAAPAIDTSSSVYDDDIPF